MNCDPEGSSATIVHPYVVVLESVALLVLTRLGLGQVFDHLDVHYRVVCRAPVERLYRAVSPTLQQEVQTCELKK